MRRLFQALVSGVLLELDVRLHPDEKDAQFTEGV